MLDIMRVRDLGKEHLASVEVSWSSNSSVLKVTHRGSPLVTWRTMTLSAESTQRMVLDVLQPKVWTPYAWPHSVQLFQVKRLLIPRFRIILASDQARSPLPLHLTSFPEQQDPV